MPRKQKSFPWFSTLLLILLVIVLIITLMPNGNSKKIDESVFNASLTAGEIQSVHINGVTVTGIYTDASGKNKVSLEDFKAGKDYDFYFSLTSLYEVDSFKQRLQDAQIDYSSEPQAESWFSRILPFLYIAMIALLAFFLIRSISKMNGKNMEFGKNRARRESNIKVSFDDVAGCDEEKREMQEIVEFLKNPKKFTDLGARIPKGVLLVGPPGTGKTLLGKAIAGEAGVPFFSITGSDFVEMYVGVGAARVRDLFETAKRNAPCLIFIDEIDAVGRQRGAGLGSTNDEREQTLNQLLVEMDGFDNNEGIIVLAATNRPDVLDPALLRAGRFDRRITVNPPDVKGREKILRLYARNKPMSENINYEQIARVLAGLTGADIENIINEAAILAARDNRSKITQNDITEGISKVSMGPKKVSRVVSEEDKRETAYHEAGHAILMRTSKYYKNEVNEVSVIPRGMAAGYTRPSPIEEKTQLTREQITEYIEFTMGGRAAEYIIYKKFSTGASNDIKQATELARRMITEFGMSDKLGPVCYAGEGEVFLGRDFQTHSGLSEQTLALIDDEVRKVLENGYQNAVKRLEQYRTIMDNMVEVLMEKETIYSIEVDMLLEGKSAKEVIAHMTEIEVEREKEDQRAREEKQKQEELNKQLEEEKIRLLRAKALAAFNGEDGLKQNSQTKTEQVEQENEKPEEIKSEIKEEKTVIEENNGSEKPKTSKTTKKTNTKTSKTDNNKE